MSLVYNLNIQYGWRVYVQTYTPYFFRKVGIYYEQILNLKIICKILKVYLVVENVFYIVIKWVKSIKLISYDKIFYFFNTKEELEKHQIWIGYNKLDRKDKDNV